MRRGCGTVWTVTELVPFSYGNYNVRTVMINGSPWFVADDVGRVLDLGNVRTSLALLDDDEKGVHSVDTLGGPQQMIVVSEAGLYSLILRSRKPEAKAFKRWITHDVLPEIRRTNQYQARPLTRRELAQKLLDAEIALEVAQEAAEVARAQLAIDSPKAAYYDSWLNTEGLIGKRDLARMLKERFGGKVTEWERQLTSGGDLALYSKERGARHGCIILADKVDQGYGANKWVEDANTGQGRQWGQGFVTRKGLEWVINKIERQS